MITGKSIMIDKACQRGTGTSVVWTGLFFEVGSLSSPKTCIIVVDL